jgi:hypothetical protein
MVLVVGGLALILRALNKPEETASPQVPTPSPVIRANPPEPIPEYPHAPPAATSPPDDLVQQMSDSTPDQSQSSVLNGQLQVRGCQKDDKWDGPYESYHENGQLDQKNTYVAGELDGPFERYSEDGQLMWKGSHDMGVKCGEWIQPGLFWGQRTVTYDPCPPRPS